MDISAGPIQELLEHLEVSAFNTVGTSSSHGNCSFQRMKTVDILKCSVSEVIFLTHS